MLLTEWQTGTGLLGALGLTAGLLPAYGPPAIGPKTMPGTWIDHTSGTLVFTSDGRVTASGVGRHRPGDHPSGPSERCSGSGTWSYEPGRDVWTQQVRIAVPGCTWPAWRVGGTAREPRIQQKVGDPGSGRLYKLRKASGRLLMPEAGLYFSVAEVRPAWIWRWKER
ncbi:hypothetical protein [Streptomyces avidinii]